MQQNVQLGLFSAEEEAQQISVAREAVLAQQCARGHPQIPRAPQRASQGSQEEETLPVDLRQLCEVSRVTVGFHEVYGPIYDRLGFNRLMGTRRVASGRVSRLRHELPGNRVISVAMFLLNNKLHPQLPRQLSKR